MGVKKDHANPIMEPRYRDLISLAVILMIMDRLPQKERINSISEVLAVFVRFKFAKSVNRVIKRLL